MVERCHRPAHTHLCPGIPGNGATPSSPWPVWSSPALQWSCWAPLCWQQYVDFFLWLNILHHLNSAYGKSTAHWKWYMPSQLQRQSLFSLFYVFYSKEYCMCNISNLVLISNDQYMIVILTFSCCQDVCLKLGLLISYKFKTHHFNQSQIKTDSYTER